MNIFKYVCTFLFAFQKKKSTIRYLWLAWLAMFTCATCGGELFFFSFHDCAVKDEKQQKKKLPQKMCAVCSVFHFFFFFFLAVCHPLACTVFSVFQITNIEFVVGSLALYHRGRWAGGVHGAPFLALLLLFSCFFNLKFSNYRHFIFSVHFSSLSF